MDKNLKLVVKRWSLPLLFAVCLCIASRTIAQPAGIMARMLFPPRNYEIALGDSITPSVRAWNRDTISDSGETIRYIIRNAVTRIAVYSHSIILPNLLPGNSLDTTFAPYYTSPQTLAQLGTFDACLIFNGDTNCARLFGLRRTPVPFRDPSDYFGKTATGDIPDQTLWTSVGATVVDGEDSTWDPPPPRYSSPGVGPDSMLSPVIRLDRKDLSGNYYSGTEVGDTLTSFPINLQGKIRINFKFDYMRAGRHHYPLRWDDSLMFGPESTILDSAGNVIRAGDSLILEFKKPSAPAENPAPDDWNEMAAIDGGHDFEFKSFFARPGTPQNIDSDSGWVITVDGKTTFLPDTSNYFTADFRFRFRLKAKDDGSNTALPKDDADAWYIDNPSVIVPLEPDFEVLWVRVVNPYTKVPQSQAVFPIFVKVFDYGPNDWYGPPFRVKIFDPNGNVVYSQQVILNQLNEGEDTVLQFPDWDASNLLENAAEYTVTAAIAQPGVDAYSEDDTTYTKFFLNIDNAPGGVQEFAYDNAGLDSGPDAGNDIPKLTHLRDQGIGFNSSASGSFAMKFQLVRPDTFYGVRLNFAEPASLDDDYFRLSLLNGDSNSCTPLDTVSQPGIQSTLLYRAGNYQFYYYPQPIPLQPGTYWISVSQLGLQNLLLCGNISRGGGEIVRANKTAPKISAIYGPTTPGAPWYGTQWGSGPGDNNGNVSCSFAVETPAGSGNWKPMMPDSGLWPTMDSSNSLIWHFLPNLDTLPWGGAGTYLPMIRPLIGRFIDIPFGVSTNPASPLFGFEPIYPNPFDPTATSTKITFTLPTQAPVSITICNIMGDVVKTLVNAAMPAGAHSVSWDGRDKHGAVVPAGIYFVSLKSAGSHATTKLIVTE